MSGRTTATLLFALALVTTTFAAVPAGGSSGSDLVADAGSSRQTDGLDQTLTVDGEAFGGAQPYAFNWSIPAVENSSERFGDASSAETTVALWGLSGTVELELEVTDAQNTTATDTVLYHVAQPLGDPVDETFEIGPGVPDETVGLSGAVDQETREIEFDVPDGAGALFARLSWQDGGSVLPVFRNDLDLVLVDPTGNEASGNQGRTGGHPETATVSNPAAGTWTAEIEAWLTGPEDARLEVVAFDARDLPSARTPGPKTFGTLDDQVLHGEPRGPDGTTGAWDLDLDGVFETTATDVTLDRAAGTHEVRYKATGPDGFEDASRISFEVEDDVEHVVPLHCGGREHWTAPAEFSHSGGTCWMHGGHQTYVLDEPVEVLGGEGFVVSVEQQFSAPTEYERAPFETPIHVQTSLDAQNWTELDAVEYDFLEDPGEGSVGLDTRQRIHYTLETDPTDARYLRFHQPRSAAQGLSGFLDRSNLLLFANETDVSAPTPDLQQGEVSLSCSEGDVLEDFFDTHPCWFGGINRYDTPSFFHTYEPGQGTTVSEVEATVQVGPWRTDDWFIPIPVPVAVSGDLPAPVDVEEEKVDAFAEQTTQTRVFVQASPDGISWKTVGNETVLFGERETFQLDLDQPVNGRFVRLVTDHHPSFDEYRASAPLHHPEAYFLYSDLTLTGQVPVGAS